MSFTPGTVQRVTAAQQEEAETRQLRTPSQTATPFVEESVPPPPPAMDLPPPPPVVETPPPPVIEELPPPPVVDAPPVPPPTGEAVPANHWAPQVPADATVTVADDVPAAGDIPMADDIPSVAPTPEQPASESTDHPGIEEL